MHDDAVHESIAEPVAEVREPLEVGLVDVTRRLHLDGGDATVTPFENEVDLTPVAIAEMAELHALGGPRLLADDLVHDERLEERTGQGVRRNRQLLGRHPENVARQTGVDHVHFRMMFGPSGGVRRPGRQPVMEVNGLEERRFPALPRAVETSVLSPSSAGKLR